MSKKTERELALNVIMEVLENIDSKTETKHCDTVLHTVFEEEQPDERAKAFIKRVAYGTIERMPELDYILNSFSKIKVKKMKPLIRNICRMAVYEIRYMEQIPESASCNEAVKLAVQKGLGGLRGFVNGVLRNTARHMDEIELKDLDIRYSMPEWIAKLLAERYGDKQAEKILKSFLVPKGLCVRVLGSKTEKEKLCHLWEEAGVRVREGYYLSQAMYPESGHKVEELPGFTEGLFTIQDESSMLPAECAGIQKGDTVIDVCAAPGGKTIQASEKAGKDGIVYAEDLTEYKIEKIKENAARLHCDNVKTVCHDARQVKEEWVAIADVVLADVPCSGIGIIGKKPDIKYHITPESVRELRQIQREILDVAVTYVKPGGVLIYSTCTLNPAENEENVSYLTSNYPFETESMEAYLPDELKAAEGGTGMLTLRPGIEKSDGFFVARLLRK